MQWVECTAILAGREVVLLEIVVCVSCGEIYFATHWYAADRALRIFRLKVRGAAVCAPGKGFCTAVGTVIVGLSCGCGWGFVLRWLGC